jgi:hypothetical protein
MAINRGTQIFACHVQIDLCTGDQSMAQEITDRHKTDVIAVFQQVRRERVSEPILILHTDRLWRRSTIAIIHSSGKRSRCFVAFTEAATA